MNKLSFMFIIFVTISIMLNLNYRLSDGVGKLRTNSWLRQGEDQNMLASLYKYTKERGWTDFNFVTLVVLGFISCSFKNQYRHMYIYIHIIYANNKQKRLKDRLKFVLIYSECNMSLQNTKNCWLIHTSMSSIYYN